MGSAGSARFSDYPDKPSQKVVSGGRHGLSGGTSGDDPCDRAFSAVLEDFEQSGYFKSHGIPPVVGTEIVVEKDKRVFARIRGAESIGNLPTRFNYLAGCMAFGRTYVGRVSSVISGPITKITIDAAPQ